MNRRTLAIAIGILACGAALWIYALHEKNVAAIVETQDEDGASPVAPPLETNEPRVVHDDARDASIVLDKAKRDALREQIYRAWGMTPPDEKSDPSTWPSGPSDGANGFGREYVRDRIRSDYFPLAKDCYEQGLKKNPALAGKIVANFRIVGSKNTGGLIDWVDMASEETTLDDHDVLECLTQSLYSVTFDAPPDDGVVTVTYPITFAPDAPDE